jgi:hypothetical protein
MIPLVGPALAADETHKMNRAATNDPLSRIPDSPPFLALDFKMTWRGPCITYIV